MKQLVIYGIGAGLLIAAMQFVQYRFLVIEHSVEMYGVLVAAAFAAAGVWLGVRLTRREIIIKEIPVEVRVPPPFAADAARAEALGITPRELEVLQLIAEGLSTREMAARLFVSENTVKTHAARVLDKLGASRRTQAVQLAKNQGILA